MSSKKGKSLKMRDFQQFTKSGKDLDLAHWHIGKEIPDYPFT
jgi:hypothetical protein